MNIHQHHHACASAQHRDLLWDNVSNSGKGKTFRVLQVLFLVHTSSSTETRGAVLYLDREL
jgi:hypothetical protein